MVNFKEKVKRFLLPSLGKKIFLACLVLVSASFLLFPNLTFAAWWDWIVGAVTFLPYLFINIIFQVILMISGALAMIASGLLQWVTGDAFVSLSYTNPANNPIIELGLNVTRGFVNMGLVLALIVIAFTTILRIKKYETQKLIFKLIVVALLINFSHVICGVIVDAANIAMNYFLQYTSGLGQLSINIVEAAERVIPKLDIYINAEKQLQQLAESTVLIVFNIIAFFVLLMFAFIFLLRYIAIWMLVILSPLAFVCYILPDTKKIWDEWWKHFMQWSFVGVIAAFFIYLGEHILETMTDKSSDFYSAIEYTADASDLGVLDTIVPYFVPLGFLIFGLIVSLKTSAMGSDVIVSGFKKTGKAAVEKPWKAAKERAEERAKSAALNLVPEALLDRLTKKEASLPSPFSEWGVGQRGFRGGVARVAGSFANLFTSPYWAVRRGAGEAGLAIEEAKRNDIKKAEDKAKKASPERNAATIVTGTKEQKMGTLKGAIEEKQIDKLNLSNEQIKQILIDTLHADVKSFKKMISSVSHLGDDIRDAVSPELAKQGGLTITADDLARDITDLSTKLAANIDPKDMPKVSKETRDSTAFRAASHRYFEPKRLMKMREEFGEVYMTRFQDENNAIEHARPGWLKKVNPRQEKFLRTNALQTQGFMTPVANEDAYQRREGVVNMAIQPETDHGYREALTRRIEQTRRAEQREREEIAAEGAVIGDTPPTEEIIRQADVKRKKEQRERIKKTQDQEARDLYGDHRTDQENNK